MWKTRTSVWLVSASPRRCKPKPVVYLFENSLSLSPGGSHMIIPKEGTIYPLKAVIILFCKLKKKRVIWRIYDSLPACYLEKDARQSIIKMCLSQVKWRINAHIQNCHQNTHRNSVMFAMFLCQKQHKLKVYAVFKCSLFTKSLPSICL